MKRLKLLLVITSVALSVIAFVSLWSLSVPKKQEASLRSEATNKKVSDTKQDKLGEARDPWSALKTKRSSRKKGIELETPADIKEEMRTDVAGAHERLGFALNLPASSLAVAAGQPEIFAGRAAAPALGEPKRGMAMIEYPNGLYIEIEFFPPDSSFIDFESYIDSNNEPRLSEPKGYSDSEAWELTSVNGYKGMQIKPGINYYGPKTGTSQSGLKEPRPAVVVWYDAQKQARFTAYAPIEAPLNELRRVVDSMY